MPAEEAMPGSSKRALSYSPSRTPAMTRLYGVTSQRSHRSHRQVPAKKLPEPLRRAVADCLSPAASQHGSSSAQTSEAARILRDFMANSSTTDMAYIMLLEHALAERDRSPAVLPRCVAYLKFYLLRYIPKLSILRQIDLFCVNSIAECESVNNQTEPELSNALTHHAKTASKVSNVYVPSLAPSNFASSSLIKSLNYVRSLVARHVPKLSFQPIAQSMVSAASKQSLPSLSSLLSRSFNSHLSPDVVSSKDSIEIKEITALPPGLSNLQEVNGEGNKYIFSDILKWRWPGEREYQMPYSTKGSNGFVMPQDIHTHGFLEVGAASLLIGDIETQIKDHTWKYFVNHNFTDVDMSRPSTAILPTSFVSSNSHLKVITAFKRMKAGPNQVWDNVPVSTFNPRVRPLFQYKHYSEQQPLRLSFAEIHEVIAEVCRESSAPNPNTNNATSRSNHAGQPATDVAISVLIKLVIDMFMMDAGTATPLTRYMLEGMLSSPKVGSRARAFDFILNLGVHAQLLEPMLLEDPTSPEAVKPLQEPCSNDEEQPRAPGKMNNESDMQLRIFTAIGNFESWLLVILFEVLRLLVQMEEREEIVWASALSCLLYFVCDNGKILRSRLAGLDIRVIKTLLEISNKYSWAEVVHCKLICMLSNMFYQTSNDPPKDAPHIPLFFVEQEDLLGGIDFICLEYSKASSKEEKDDLFLVLFDYVVHQINEVCLANGASVYAYDDIQPLVSMLMLANAPEAFHIAVKHGVDGIGEILKRSISAALLRSSNYERQNMLLDKIIRKLDTTLSTFTRLDSEFSYMIRLTKTCKSFMSIKDVLSKTDIGEKAKVSWATLHSLLHSDRSVYRHHGYIWLVELLLMEISESRNGNIFSNVKNLQQLIAVAFSQDSVYSEVPLAISIFCGLLKSKHNFVRWGFLFVLEKLLTRCKLLLDETELQDTSAESSASDHTETRLNKANAVIDMMNSALSLVVQINETDHISILKMCDILFAQLCLRLHSATRVPLVDFNGLNHLFGCTTHSRESGSEIHVSLEGPRSKQSQDKLPQTDDSLNDLDRDSLICETTSMAALLLRGHAIAPMQLVARVPSSLFYWPLIQLAGAATDDVALGVAVGSNGGGNIPGATSDIRAALLLLLIGKCTADQGALSEIEGKEFFRGLLDDMDSRVAYYSAAFLLKRMMTEEPETYQRMLKSLIFKAQQSNNEKLLENPYLQMRGILQLSNDLGTIL
ncbi:LOW QUALITY PROTEIN: uncharacterized protein LOC141820987 [Curcuma longa]|uniref:LOW QUALITY PROTEIN: uncharacterized protein LOC141820987 n=1 Tax=Curcuma longa TaxID=136217 RepID=UPI003D9F4003